ncbi:DeoR family transcriptional regulator [Enterococcus hirae]|uniref:DeoR family transcriptional regulator n=1 Tax=Enterococcus hirae TaxID=1354 RepID=UPI001A96D73B|nr:DeoR family transcriptional regulator [Enterococcus hirae]MBO1103563.1 DeoR family transcriptional regulator [Enterococcus hirae]
MLTDYIEKDIMRRVKITEYFYELTTIKIKDIANRLRVSLNTIRRDINLLIDELKNYISNYENVGNEVTIIFMNNISKYDLVREIYSESKFLRICSRVIVEGFDYLEIADEEFLSVSKVFQMKNKIFSFFESIGVIEGYENISFNDDELTMRNLILALWIRCDYLEKYVDNRKWIESEKFVKELLKYQIKNINIKKREYQTLTLGCYLMISRSKDYELVFPEEERQRIIEDLYVYTIIKKLSKDFFSQYKLSDDEIVYFSFIYYLLVNETKNYSVILYNYYLTRKRWLLSSNIFIELLLEFENEFNISLINNIMFEKPLIDFLGTSWKAMQYFLLENYYYLSEEQILLSKKIRKIMTKVLKKDKNYYFTDDSIEKLAYQVSSILEKKIDKTIICIVTDNDNNHILYRSTLKRWLGNIEECIFDENVYYSLEELENSSRYFKRIIVCEKNLARLESSSQEIFLISRNSIKEDISLILDKLYNNCY